MRAGDGGECIASRRRCDAVDGAAADGRQSAEPASLTRRVGNICGSVMNGGTLSASRRAKCRAGALCVARHRRV